MLGTNLLIHFLNKQQDDLVVRKNTTSASIVLISVTERLCYIIDFSGKPHQHDVNEAVLCKIQCTAVAIGSLYFATS